MAEERSRLEQEAREGEGGIRKVGTFVRPAGLNFNVARLWCVLRICTQMGSCGGGRVKTFFDNKFCAGRVDFPTSLPRSIGADYGAAYVRRISPLVWRIF